MVNNYVIPANPGIDMMEFAIRDLEFAAKYLPKVQSNQGRVTQYSAYGMLSRLYLSMAGLTTEGAYDGTNAATDFNRGTRNPYYLDLARKAALKVIEESGMSLTKTTVIYLPPLPSTTIPKAFSNCNGCKEPQKLSADAAIQWYASWHGAPW